jgi:hypothetical protein
MVAEVTTAEHSPRMYREITLHPVTNGTIDRLLTDKENTVLYAITTDEGVAELIETAVEKSGNEHLKVLVNPYQVSSPNYLDWVKNQTIEADQSQAFYNIDPFANSTPVANETVAKLDHFHNKPNTLL